MSVVDVLADAPELSLGNRVGEGSVLNVELAVGAGVQRGAGNVEAATADIGTKVAPV